MRTFSSCSHGRDGDRPRRAAQQRGATSIRVTCRNRSRTMPKMVEELGGAETGPTCRLCRSVGRRVAAYSGVLGLALRFTVLNSAVENAFAMPGGYVYITRQLMALMDDESELAFALGHEVGHIAANHAQARGLCSTQSARRHRRDPRSVFGGGGIGSMSQQRAELATLSFSREQEYQADTLGLRY